MKIMQLRHGNPETPKSFHFFCMKTISLILFLFYSLVPNAYGIILGGNETDQEALLQFKLLLSNDPLGVMNSWNSSTHFCSWFGVTCGARHRRITVLSLNSLGLSGTISPHIGNLSFLRELQLSNNSFHSGIPAEIGHLSRLRKLSLRNNSLSGAIPSNLSQCSNLAIIDLGRNSLEGEIPPGLGSLSNLLGILLDSNHLIGEIPHSLGNSTSLELIRMSQNNLTGPIPDTLGNLRNLTRLILWDNKLSGMIPFSIFNVSSLQIIDLAENQLQGTLPPSLGSTLPNLQQLGLSANQLSGRIPDSISNISNLLSFEIVFNHITGRIPSFGKMTRLQWFNIGVNQFGNGQADELQFLCSLANSTALELVGLESNGFGGIIPECIGNLSNTLQFFGISNNSLSGSLPPSIGNLVNLEILKMWNAGITGNIPREIGNLRNLQVLDLGKNNFTGYIPGSLGKLTMLTQLSFTSNRLQGKIPWALSKCQNLLLLDFSDNRLNGSIPPEIMTITSLSIYADFSKNDFTGEVPIEVGNFKNLGQLNLQQNRLSGTIPSSLGNCIDLERLFIQDNIFEGSIPSSFSSLKGIQVLNLSNNRLSGQIPEFLTDLPLTDLGLAFNRFEGALPTQGVFGNKSSISIIGNDKLCGGLPELNLPKCSTKESQGKRSSRTSIKRKVIIFTFTGLGVLGTALLLIFLYILWSKKHRKSVASNVYSNNEVLNVSYQCLVKATNGFSSTNLVGVGSFGSVYKGVVDWNNNKTVAVKVLNLTRHGASKSFIAECEALRNIRHRNLVKILTACSSSDYRGNDFKALIYEFMENGSLDEWLHPQEPIENTPRKLDLLQRLNIAIDVACALDYLHHQCEEPIVHCDLKPSNILLDEEMIGHVGDFGLARFLSNVTHKLITQETSSIGVKGSFGYIAPEYATGGEVSTYGDVYSYGILILEMFTCKRPTDDMFRDGLTLHCFAKAALPDQFERIVDPTLIQQVQQVIEDNYRNSIAGDGIDGFDKIRECLALIFEIGVTCSSEIPKERMNMNNVVMALERIKHKLINLL